LPGELQELIERADRTRRARARTIVDDCLARLPHYQGLPEPMLAEIRESILKHLAIFYRITLRMGRPLERGDLVYSRRLARKRAQQGVPLGEFLTFFLVGLNVAWDHLIESAGDVPALRSELLDRVGIVLSNQTQLMTALTEAYVEERARLSRFRERDLDDLVQLLLSEEAVDSVIEARTRALAIDPDEPRVVALFGLPLPEDDGAIQVGAQDLRRWLAESVPTAEVWVGRAGEGFVALLPEDVPTKAVGRVAEDLLGGVHAGLGGVGTGVEGLRRSAREAFRALAIGRWLDGPKRVLCFADVALLDLVGIDSERAEAFASDTLGPLLARGVSPDYLETLHALAASNHRIKVAAAALDIHPHTLSYRIKQLRGRFGLDLDDATVRLRVQLALLIHRAREHDGGATPEPSDD
jgi:sugar diacid utilization regulator